MYYQLVPKVFYNVQTDQLLILLEQDNFLFLIIDVLIFKK